MRLGRISDAGGLSQAGIVYGCLMREKVVKSDQEWRDQLSAEEYEFHALRKKETRATGYQQVSEVTLSRGLVWSDISIESTGGKSIALEGVSEV